MLIANSLHEFLRRRARLQRVDEAVRRNVVIGFFDTVYWSRQFRNHMASKHAGRMTMVPTFTVPEIFVDDEAAHDEYGVSPFDGNNSGGLGPPSTAPSSAVSSPRMGAVTPPSGSENGETMSRMGLLSRTSTNSIQQTPTASPTRSRGPPLIIPTQGHGHGHTGSDVSENWHMAAAMSPARSRPSSPLGVEPAEGSGAARSRAGSNVSARDVLEVLEDSAWGESIRKSFSMRRPSGDGGGGPPRI